MFNRIATLILDSSDFISKVAPAKKEDMNCTQLNRIPIDQILLKLYGESPRKTKGDALWYSSPNKTDNTPSLKVRIPENDFIDFSSCNPSTGKPFKGRVIDLVCYLSNVNVKRAMQIVGGENIAPISSFFEKQKTEYNSIHVKNIQALKNRNLIQYLENKRGIKLKYACKYINEIYYTALITKPDGTKTRKLFYALAFENDKGGFEIRNKYFKGCTSPKAITTILGSNEQLNVFEGFLDLCSALTYYKTNTIKHTTIVLNSLAFLQQVKDLVLSFPQVNLWFDNDEAGINAASEIKAIHPNVKDYSQMLYDSYKDFNQFLTK